ncbi:MAG TPA: transcriptional repressor LexA, partial [Chloroflexota bacterium]
ILKYIEAYLDERGYPPSIREIGDRVGISSTSVVDYNLKLLERAGYIRRDREVSRGLELMGAPRAHRQASPRLVRIPVVGRIAAGLPIEAIEDPSDVVELPVGSVPDDCFALRVQGTSMIEDHIDDGDLVLVRPQPSVDNGDIAVAIVSDSTENGGATLKRFYREGNTIRLQPRNPAMQPILVPADQVEVRGKVVKLLRDL